MSKLPPFEERIAVYKTKQDEFYAAVGRLVLKWAKTELLLYKVLLHYGRISDPVGRALLSGTRANPMIDYLKAIAENTKMPEVRIADLRCVCDQIATINTMRDRIVHYGRDSFTAVYLGGELSSFDQLITNIARSSRAEANSFMVSVSTQSIDLMITDLGTIGQHLSRHLTTGVSEENFLPYRARADASTWLYKSPQSVSMKGKSRATAHKRSTQRQPSQK